MTRILLRTLAQLGGIQAHLSGGLSKTGVDNLFFVASILGIFPLLAQSVAGGLSQFVANVSKVVALCQKSPCCGDVEDKVSYAAAKSKRRKQQPQFSVGRECVGVCVFDGMMLHEALLHFSAMVRRCPLY
eukprot:566385-Rhodomonas_salina.3